VKVNDIVSLCKQMQMCADQADDTRLLIDHWQHE